MILNRRRAKKDELVFLTCQNCGARIRRSRKAILEFTGTRTPELVSCVYCSDGMWFGRED